jgi:hypothetical protein
MISKNISTKWKRASILRGKFRWVENKT